MKSDIAVEVRYRCLNPDCACYEQFLDPAGVVDFGPALYHDYERQGTLLDPTVGRDNVTRLPGTEADPFPLPCGPVQRIEGPCRIRLRRTKGWRKPPDAVVVTRPGRWGNPFYAEDGQLYVIGPPLLGPHPSNPAILGQPSTDRGRLLQGWTNGTQQHALHMAVMLHRAHLLYDPSDPGELDEPIQLDFGDVVPRWQFPYTADDVRRELRGLDLCCWCRLDQPDCHVETYLEVANS